MAVLVPDRKMPKSCWDCSDCVKDKEHIYYWCHWTKKETYDYKETRHPSCPLKEVK